MKTGIYTTAILCLILLLGGSALGQYQPNELCLHASAHSWMGGPGYGGYGFPNHALGKYFPSFTHWAATPSAPGTQDYPTKVSGWGWKAMQGQKTSSYWFWSSCLQKSWDEPYSTTTYGYPMMSHTGMAWDYPRNLCLGIGDIYPWPDAVLGGIIPGFVPQIGNTHAMIYPSSYGIVPWNLNIFAVSSGSVITPVPTPMTVWSFALVSSCTSFWSIPSSYSIYEYVWDCRPQCKVPQYLMISVDEFDCTGTAAGMVGNKTGRNYTIGGDYENGLYWSWPASLEAGMCLFLCDIITLPVNSPGSPAPLNPYNAYGFDVGVAIVTPYASSGCAQLRFMTQANQAPGLIRVVLGAFNYPPTFAPPHNWWDQCLTGWTINGWRVPHAWDFITTLVLGVAPIFIHIPQPGYPSHFLSSSVGAHTLSILMPPDPALQCLELHFSSMQFPISGHPVYPDQIDGPPSAGFMATYW